ncbi:MAG: hypothetical protein JSS76_00560 [Bacteroidetes bacterium]|nr:hypothetical protein [Bacteroidota bacterium]
MRRFIDQYVDDKKSDATFSVNQDMLLGFELLKAISRDLSTANYKQISNILNTGMYGAFSGTVVEKGTIICRARTNRCGPTYFKSEKDLTYISDPNVLARMQYYGRANLPAQSIFYGSLGSEQIPMAHLTSVFECSDRYRTRDPAIPYAAEEEIFSCGIWRAKKNFEVVELVFSKDVLQNNPYVSHRLEMYKEALLDMNPDFRKHCIEILRFMSEEFAKKLITNSDDYKISCAYANLIWSKLKLSGILFPSVQSGYHSFNIALTPRAVDKFLQFDSAVMVRVKYKGFEMFVEDLYRLKSNSSKQRFEWEHCPTRHF